MVGTPSLHYYFAYKDRKFHKGPKLATTTFAMNFPYRRTNVTCEILRSFSIAVESGEKPHPKAK